jgi:hypothetical protein
LGEESRREALFCLTTLKRAYNVVQSIKGGAPDGKQEADSELAANFNFSALYSQLHFDCLRLVMKQRIKQDPEVIDEMLQGARSSVMAYSFARQGAELRNKREPFLLDTQFDQEDQELLEESFLDFSENESGIDAQS